MGCLIFERQPEEDLFRRLPEGWVFTAPGVRLFGGRTSYLVNDIQKAELLARLDRWRILVWIVLLVPLFALAQSFEPRGEQDWIHFAIFAASFALYVFLLVAVAVPAFQMFILRPILTGAVPTTSAPTPVRIGFWDGLCKLLRSLAQAFSSRWLTVFCLFFCASSINAGYHVLMSRNEYLYAISTLFLTVVFGLALLLKLRERQSHE